MADFPKIRLLIADDQQIIRDGIRAVLEGTEIEVVGEASSGEEAVEHAKQDQFDVALLDIRMKNGDGFFALSHLKQICPQLACLMVSTFENTEYIERSRQLGAAGYLLKGASTDHLVDSIRTVAAGGQPFLLYDEPS